MEINDISLCFINCHRSELPYRVIDFDLANSFNHIFFIGDLNAHVILNNTPFRLLLFYFIYLSNLIFII